MARAIGAPLTKNSADHRRALQPAFERCATPLTMGTAIFVTLSTRVRGGVPLGAPTRLSCAAAGVSSGLAGAVKAAIAKSKLCKIEAETVERLGVYHLRTTSGHVWARLGTYGHVWERLVRLVVWCVTMTTSHSGLIY